MRGKMIEVSETPQADCYRQIKEFLDEFLDFIQFAGKKYFSEQAEIAVYFFVSWFLQKSSITRLENTLNFQSL